MQKRDTGINPTEIKLYSTVADVPDPLWEDAAAVDPALAAKNSGAAWLGGGLFEIEFLGGLYKVDLAARTVTAPVSHKPADFERAMVLLTYLRHAQDFGPSGRQVAARELNGGDMFFAGPHALATKPLTQKYASTPEALIKKALSYGAERLTDGGQFCFKWRLLPHITVTYNFYPEDDEFPADVTYTIDSYAHHHLPLDAVWSMINVAADELAGMKGAA